MNHIFYYDVKSIDSQRVKVQGLQESIAELEAALLESTAAGDRFDRSRGRSIESLDSIDSIIFRSLAKFLKNRSWRDDRFHQKIVKIRAILAIFRPFEDFGDFRFDRFDIFFDSIDTEPNDRWGPPWLADLRLQVSAVRSLRGTCITGQ